MARSTERPAGIRTLCEGPRQVNPGPAAAVARSAIPCALPACRARVRQQVLLCYPRTLNRWGRCLGWWAGLGWVAQYDAAAAAAAPPPSPAPASLCPRHPRPTPPPGSAPSLPPPGLGTQARTWPPARRITSATSASSRCGTRKRRAWWTSWCRATSSTGGRGRGPGGRLCTRACLAASAAPTQPASCCNQRPPPPTLDGYIKADPPTSCCL
jgi:hypothetical protein